MITLVPREEVPKVWPMAEPEIARALHTEAIDTIDVFTDIMQGKRALWMAIVDGNIIGYTVTSIQQYPLMRVMTIDFLAGHNVDEWLDEGAEVLNAYAFDCGCAKMEFRGRVGWKPRVQKYGWEPKSINFERDIVPPGETHGD